MERLRKQALQHLSGLESVLFWGGLRSYVFHVGAESDSSQKIRDLKSVLSHPALCCSIEELSSGDASHVMHGEFAGMKSDLHSLRVGKKRILNDHAVYGDDLSELQGAVNCKGSKIFRFKVLIDADMIDRSSVGEIMLRLNDLRHAK